MIREAVDRLIESHSPLSGEAEVYAAAARRLADLLDGAAPSYAAPALARELRAATAALTGAPQVGQGVSEAELEALLGGRLELDG